MKFKEIDDYISKNFYYSSKYNKEIINKSIMLINKIRKALATNSTLNIWGDKDVDGICASLFLKEMIEDYAKAKKREANINIFIPSREAGYGITMEDFEKINKEGGYIFTLDNGTHRSFLDNIPKDAQDRVFIIDHHPNGDTSDLNFVLNPNKDGKMIISTGYLLDCVYEVLLKVDKDYAKVSHRDRYADLVAMTLISDMADLNNIKVRNLISKGFEKIEKKERLLYKHLFPKKDMKITYNDIAFELNPRINSIGRLSSNPKDAVAILGFKETSNRGLKSIEYINSINELRKTHLNNFINIALDEIKESVEKSKNLIFYYNKDIPLGLNGLIAQRIYEVYDIPALVCSNSKTTDKIKGSGRGFNIKYMLNMFRDNDIFTYGGHNEALGCEIKDVNYFNKIMERLNSKNIPFEKEFKNIILEGRHTINDYIEFSKELSKKTNTIPFKQKMYMELKDVSIAIKKVFRNNFCYIEIKDEVSNEKISYFTKHNIAKELIDNKEKFYISVYAEYNSKKAIQDFSGEIVLEKNISKGTRVIEDAPDVNLYR